MKNNFFFVVKVFKTSSNKILVLVSAIKNIIIDFIKLVIGFTNRFAIFVINTKRNFEKRSFIQNWKYVAIFNFIVHGILLLVIDFYIFFFWVSNPNISIFRNAFSFSNNYMVFSGLAIVCIFSFLGHQWFSKASQFSSIASLNVRIIPFWRYMQALFQLGFLLLVSFYCIVLLWNWILFMVILYFFTNKQYWFHLGFTSKYEDSLNYKIFTSYFKYYPRPKPRLLKKPLIRKRRRLLFFSLAFRRILWRNFVIIMDNKIKKYTWLICRRSIGFFIYLSKCFLVNNSKTIWGFVHGSTGLNILIFTCIFVEHFRFFIAIVDYIMVFYYNNKAKIHETEFKVIGGLAAQSKMDYFTVVNNHTFLNDLEVINTKKFGINYPRPTRSKQKLDDFYSFANTSFRTGPKFFVHRFGKKRRFFLSEPWQFVETGNISPLSKSLPCLEHSRAGMHNLQIWLQYHFAGHIFDRQNRIRHLVRKFKHDKASIMVTGSKGANYWIGTHLNYGLRFLGRAKGYRYTLQTRESNDLEPKLHLDEESFLDPILTSKNDIRKLFKYVQSHRFRYLNYRKEKKVFRNYKLRKISFRNFDFNYGEPMAETVENSFLNQHVLWLKFHELIFAVCAPFFYILPRAQIFFGSHSSPIMATISNGLQIIKFYANFSIWRNFWLRQCCYMHIFLLGKSFSVSYNVLSVLFYMLANGPRFMLVSLLQRSKFWNNFSRLTKYTFYRIHLVEQCELYNNNHRKLYKYAKMLKDTDEVYTALGMTIPKQSSRKPHVSIYFTKLKKKK